jgi:hypothetical protein
MNLVRRLHVRLVVEHIVEEVPVHRGVTRVFLDV